MAPTPSRSLIALQNSRLAEIELTNTRLREKTPSAFNLNIIVSRIEALNKIWSDARNTHAEIIVRANIGEDPYITDNVFARLQTLYEDTLDFLLTLQTELEAGSQPTLPLDAFRGASSPSFEPRAAKLPRLDLPTFSGKYEDWENFCDLFTTLVHNAPRLEDATKLQYLKTCLKDTAADLVKDVATTNANYASTWQALKVRFHNPRLIVNNHLRALMDIQHLKRESAVELRSFTDEAQRIVRALTNLNMPVTHWDAWFVFILAARLDPDSRKAWETELSGKDHRTVLAIDSDLLEARSLDRFPKFTDFAEFLENRARTLSMIASESSRTDKKFPVTSKPIPGSRKVFHGSSSRIPADVRIKCPLCSNHHQIQNCHKFKAKTPYERRGEIRRLQLCYNCLGRHRVIACTAPSRCTECKEKHHTMIHCNSVGYTEVARKNRVYSNEPRDKKPENPSATNVHTASLSARRCSVILATAQLMLLGPHGGRTRVRALLDQGSETSFVSDSVASLLGLPKLRVNIPLSGIGTTTAGTARSATRLTLQSLIDTSFQLETNALILSKLTSRLPTRRTLEIDIREFADLPLADPQFYIPDAIDVLLGADIYGQLLRPGLRKFPFSSLTAQDTALGWIVSGPVLADSSRRAATPSPTPLQALHSVTREDLNESLQRFWNLEELPSSISSFSPQDDACEKQFRSTHTRDSEGRFVVRLPLKSEPPAVGLETRRMAIGSLSHLYRRFDRDPKLALAYREFMSTYEALGHMERVPASEITNPHAWYLPHHAVVRSMPSDWKIRVVFDASRKTRENKCLNDFLLPGPALQNDLSLILLNWRRYRFVFTADIVKMFRQIRVVPSDRDLQRIVWAPKSTDTPVEYRLTTVTYGTACAPYLAIRTLAQLAEDEKSRFPLGARCIDFNTYVDDTFAGADELPVAIRTRQELIELLRTAGIELDKWAANHRDLLPPRAPQSEDDESKEISFDESIKTLGVQ